VLQVLRVRSKPPWIYYWRERIEKKGVWKSSNIIIATDI